MHDMALLAIALLIIIDLVAAKLLYDIRRENRRRRFVNDTRRRLRPYGYSARR